MKGYIANIEKISLENHYFRQVLYTAKHSQLVVMSLKPSEDIGEETHPLDQFIRCEKGQGKVVLDDVESEVSDGYVVIIPAGVVHNIVNTSDTETLQLYTLYSPPNHKDGKIHKTKTEASKDEDDEFDGTITE